MSDALAGTRWRVSRTGQYLRWATGALLCLGIAACGGGGGGATTPAPMPVPPPPAPQPAAPTLFAVVSDAEWDDTAVRQVLHVFAFGSHATDAQIRAWADLPPLEAADQIMSMAARDDRLSPPDPQDLAVRGAALEALAAHWSSDTPANLMPPARRALFRLDNRQQTVAPDLLWSYGTVMRGVNPLRSRIAFWETNYHMAIHQLLGLVNDAQTVRYFDGIAAALAAGDSYDDVMALAAASAAVAMQYGHHKNVYENGAFSGNEDFGREFHQLFFGILGRADPIGHEEVTVKNTARALTGIRTPYQFNGHRVTTPIYDAALHDPNDLMILGQSVSGSTALEKLRRLGPIAGAHPESLDNLPLRVIGGLADDMLDAARSAELRRAWRAMAPRNLLRFLRDYAASPLFLRGDRVKYLTSVERNLLLQTLVTLNNREAYADLYDVRGYRNEGVEAFEPAHNVFGGQTGLEAATSSEVFRIAYQRSTEHWALLATSSAALPDGAWEKDWRGTLPADGQQRYGVAHVARWIWQRFIADGGAHLGVLERAQLHALLAEGSDFGSVATAAGMAPPPYDGTALGAAPLNGLIDQLGAATLALDAADPIARQRANAHIGQAINFIMATPYAFARQGPLP